MHIARGSNDAAKQTKAVHLGMLIKGMLDDANFVLADFERATWDRPPPTWDSRLPTTWVLADRHTNQGRHARIS